MDNVDLTCSPEINIQATGNPQNAKKNTSQDSLRGKVILSTSVQQQGHKLSRSFVKLCTETPTLVFDSKQIKTSHYRYSVSSSFVWDISDIFINTAQVFYGNKHKKYVILAYF